MRLKFLFLGRTRSKFLVGGQDNYLKRIKGYLRAQEIIIKENKNISPKNAAARRTDDTTRLLARLKPEDVFVLLDPRGRALTSPQLAAWLKEQMDRGVKSVAFGLGGPLGLDQRAAQRADLKLALSRLTLTHEMSRLVLLEQVYRALTLNAGHPYHK